MTGFPFLEETHTKNYPQKVDEPFKSIKSISILVSILNLPLNSQGSVKWVRCTWVQIRTWPNDFDCRVLKSVFDIIKIGVNDNTFKRVFFMSNQLEAVIEFILKHFSVKNYETLLGDAFKIISSLLIHFTANEEAKPTMINTVR